MAHDYSVSKADVLILVVMEEGQRLAVLLPSSSVIAS